MLKQLLLKCRRRTSHVLRVNAPTQTAPSQRASRVQKDSFQPPRRAPTLTPVPPTPSVRQANIRRLPATPPTSRRATHACLDFTKIRRRLAALVLELHPRKVRVVIIDPSIVGQLMPNWRHAPATICTCSSDLSSLISVYYKVIHPSACSTSLDLFIGQFAYVTLSKDCSIWQLSWAGTLTTSCMHVKSCRLYWPQGMCRQMPSLFCWYALQRRASETAMQWILWLCRTRM